MNTMALNIVISSWMRDVNIGECIPCAESDKGDDIYDNDFDSSSKGLYKGEKEEEEEEEMEEIGGRGKMCRRVSINSRDCGTCTSNDECHLKHEKYV